MPETTVRSSTRVAGFEDPELDFQLLRQLGTAAYGGASVGECLAVAAEIREAGPQAWTEAFAELAARQEVDGRQRAAAGHRIGARDRYLQASNSYADIDQIPDDEMPPPVKEMSRSLIRRFGKETFLETFHYLREFTVDPESIDCPALALVGEGEGGEPLRQYEQFCDRAGGKVTRRLFTAIEGADTHCQLGNLALSNAVTLDWLDELMVVARA